MLLGLFLNFYSTCVFVGYAEHSAALEDILDCRNNLYRSECDLPLDFFFFISLCNSKFFLQFQIFEDFWGFFLPSSFFIEDTRNLICLFDFWMEKNLFRQLSSSNTSFNSVFFRGIKEFRRRIRFGLQEFWAWRRKIFMQHSIWRFWWSFFFIVRFWK